MANSLFNEGLNAVLCVLDFCGFAVFALYIFHNKGMNYDALKPAIAIATHLFGLTIVRAAFWIQRHQINVGFHDGSLDLSALFYIIVGIGGFISGIGILCMIRIFSPIGWGIRNWVGTVLLATVITTISLFLSWIY